MLIWTHIPLSLLALIPLVLASQIPLKSSSPTVLSTNIVDALSADKDYTSLIRLLQRAKLIPTLNKLNGTTFFAPTNDAIKHHLDSNPLWAEALSEDSPELKDNIQEKLRQELFYHLLNYTIFPLPSEQSPSILDTLHFPREPVKPPSGDPPPNPPWLPTPGGTLGGLPQKLRLATRDSEPFVGTDAFGKGGSQLIKAGVNASNGALYGIDTVLEVPPDLATVIQKHPALTYLTKILNPDLISFLNGTSELTLFLPVDSAWDALPDYERLYLESTLATDDLTRIVNMHAVAKKKVLYAQSINSGDSLKTIDGQSLDISKAEDGKTAVSSAELLEPDIYASNGVIHTISSLLIPPGAIQITPEKTLLLYNCTSFVSLLHSVNLTSLINDTHTHWTILAPRDDVIGLFGEHELPEKGSEELKKFLQYHFIPGKKTQDKLKDGMLLETALEEEGLAGGKQVLGVEVNDHKGSKEDKSVRFGGASVIGDPVKTNNTLIYFVSRPLTPPVDALTTALPTLDLSAFLAAVFSADLADKLKATPRTTLLIPHNSAFKRLGMLVSAHLLAAASKPDLERVIEHHVITDVEYQNALVSDPKRTFPTLEGSDVHLERSTAENGTMMFTASGGWAEMRSQLYPKNALTRTGVIHEVSDLMIPRSVNLTVNKLVRAAKATTMASMVIKAGLDWILNGTAPPENSKWANKSLEGIGWTLLCPTDDAFKDIKLKELYNDTERLEAIVTQHLIPTQAPSRLPPDSSASFDFRTEVINNNRPLVIDDATTYTTLLSADGLYGDIVFRETTEKEGFLVGIKGARGTNGQQDWARVLSWGRATTGGGTGGVIQIDRLLMPYSPSIWNAYGVPIAVGAIGVILIGLFFFGVRTVWKRDTTEATYEPIGGFGRDDDDA